MKMVKNIAIVALATTFMFAGVSFHTANNYMDMDGTTSVTPSWGVNYALNDNTSIGWDSALGMMMSFDAPAGVSLRLGWTAGNADVCTGATDAGGDAFDDGTSAGCEDPAGDGDDGVGGDDATETAGVWTAGNPAGTSIGLGYTWWTGGSSFKTSISTNFDYIMRPDAGLEVDWEENLSNLSVSVGFGF